MSSITEEINDILTPISVARHYLGEPQKTGRSYSWYNCFMHKESAPSLRVFHDIGKGFFCEGCRTGGGAVKLVENLFQLDNLSACRKLEADFGLHVINSARRETAAQKRNREKQKAAVETAKTYLTAQHITLALIQQAAWRDNVPESDMTAYGALSRAVYDTACFRSVEQSRHWHGVCKAVCGAVYRLILDRQVFYADVVAGRRVLTGAEVDGVIEVAELICRGH